MSPTTALSVIPRQTRVRPVLVLPALLGLGFVLAMLDSTGVSPYAALRTLIVVPAATLIVTVVLTRVLGDADLAVVVATVLLLTLAAMGQPLSFVLVIAALVLVVFLAMLTRRRAVPVRWRRVTRIIGIVTGVLMLVIAIRAVQDGRLAEVVQDLVRDGPLRPHRALRASADVAHPDVYLILLDGYPRADKLASEFGIDNSAFLRALEDKGFSIAEHSRSNYLLTYLTLLSLFNGRHVDALGSAALSQSGMRLGINRADALRPFRAAGYEVISVSSGFELVALRDVDRFVDTGQINEFERVLIEQTFVPLLRIVDPGYLTRQAGQRTLASLRAANALATPTGPPRVVFVHIASPHSPLQFDAEGRIIEEAGDYEVFIDHEQYLRMGPSEYANRLRDQLAFLNREVSGLVSAIDMVGRPSVVVVFSDHGSGAKFTAEDQRDGHADAELRSANLLAVRGLGEIDDRMTLVNLLPEIAQRRLGAPYVAQPDEVRGADGDWRVPLGLPAPQPISSGDGPHNGSLDCPPCQPAR